MILYLHGFRSSPQSFKARLLGERMRALGKGGHYICPQLPASPQQAIDLCLSLVDAYSKSEIHVVGSSLGGFYATHLAERLGCRAVVINPAVKSFRDLEKYVGATTRFHTDEPFDFRQEYIDELRALAVERITAPERYFLMAATGDEILDWREMVSHYPGARHRIIEGSDHGISEFADYAEEVLAFCGVLPQGQS
jgi:predicted esterase YcpF (UPF0227 family)